MLIGMPVLKHIRIDSRTLLDMQREKYDGADLSIVGSKTNRSHGKSGIIMVTIIKQAKGRNYKDGQELDQA